MKVVQVIPHIGNESSGPTYYMLNMCKALVGHGVEMELHALVDRPAEANCKVCVYPQHELPIASLGRSPEMLKGLVEAAKSADIIHNNSLWMMPNVYPYWAARGTKAKVVTSPHGTLSPWALMRGRIKKAIFGNLLQYPALKMTDMFHATCEKEYNEIRAAGYRQPVAIVSIGMDIPEEVPIKPKESERKIMFLGRVHKVKAIDRLILAFEASGLQLEGWRLEIAGPDDGARGELEQLIAAHKIQNVMFLGEVNGAAKYALFASADVSVLPSHTENFGVSVTESLASGTPVIASKNTPWKGLVDNKCGWWVANDPATLSASLREMAGLTHKARRVMGQNGAEWLRREFVWSVVGEKMRQAYEWLLDPKNKPRPKYVRID